MIDTKHFKELLATDYTTLENELKTVGRKNPDNTGDWEAIEKDTDPEAAEEGDVAEGMEEYENNKGILETLETKLIEVKDALRKIEEGTYGICELGGEEIELDRLEANPSARTCKKHMNEV